MSFGPDLTQWFGRRAFFSEDDVNSLKDIVRDYHTTMDNVREAADSVSYLARGIGQGLRGLGIVGPWQEIGNPLSDMWATGEMVGVPTGIPPAQSVANTQAYIAAATGDTSGLDLVTCSDPNNVNDPYCVSPQYAQAAVNSADAVLSAPGEAFTYVSDTVSKYFHYALIAGIVVGVVVFLPEIKAVTRVLRSATK